MKKLTNRQKEVLNFIEQYQKENGVSPSIRDIGKYFGFSIKAAYDHIMALQKKKVIIRDGRSRAIVINNKKLDFNLNSEVIDNFNKFAKTNKVMKNIPRAKECLVCGNKENVHRHHEDYNKPKEYIELCRKHHLSWHVFKRIFEKNGYIITISVK